MPNDVFTSIESEPLPPRKAASLPSVADQMKTMAATLDELDRKLIDLETDFRERIEALRTALLGAVK